MVKVIKSAKNLNFSSRTMLGVSVFFFQILIQSGQIIKMPLNSSRNKTESLDLFFSVINV